MSSLKIKIAVNGKSHKSVSMQLHEVEFDSFANSMKVCKQGGKYESYFIRGGEMSITPADLDAENPELRVDHYHRNDKSLLSADLLILDADGSVGDGLSAPDGAMISACLKEMNVKHFIYSTFSHKYDGKGNRYRVVIPCKMYNKIQLKATVEKIISEIRDKGCPLGDVNEAKTWSQAWFFPTRKHVDDDKFEYYEFLSDSADVYEAVSEKDAELYIKSIDKRRKHNRDKKNKVMRENDEENDNSNSDNDNNMVNRNVDDPQSIEDIINIIITGSAGLHGAINDYLYGQIKDGVNKRTAIETVKGLMQANPNKDSRWSARYEEIERSCEGAIDRVKNHGFTEDVTCLESAKKLIKKRKSMHIVDLPEYPYGFMEEWPDPWPQIWKNWKRFPSRLSEPLLIPTILSFHGYLLNGKYLNERRRRPNLYQLNLAESTAYKDTNSKDVLRSMSLAMAKKGVFNSIFDRLSNIDSNITSDTALLKSLDENDGKMFWINTEATRVFQMLSYSGSVNSAVMGLADKMIEIVDGHEITGKAKAKDSLGTILDPNIQIMFYAQPETIEKYINIEMVDSGFLGRALITLDVDTKDEEPDIFARMAEDHCELDNKLAEFYASININGIAEKYICKLPDSEFIKAKMFERDVLHPLLMPLVNDHYVNTSVNNDMRKMISRIGNSAEQLYSIVLGISREFDIVNGVEPRESIDFNCLIPILKFWAESKYYVVREYINQDGDIIAHAIEETMINFLSGELKIDKKFKPYIEAGKVPRAQLINSIRNQKRLMSALGAHGSSQITFRCGQTIDTMIKNEMLSEYEVKINGSRKSTKMLGFG